MGWRNVAGLLSIAIEIMSRISRRKRVGNHQEGVVVYVGKVLSSICLARCIGGASVLVMKRKSAARDKSAFSSRSMQASMLELAENPW